MGRDEEEGKKGMRPEIVSTTTNGVETLHYADSDMIPDVSVSEIGVWITGFLGEDGATDRQLMDGFEAEYGLNNLSRLACAQEIMQNEGSIIWNGDNRSGSWSLSEEKGGEKMVKIKVNRGFSYGDEKYEAGETYDDVDEDLAEMAENNGFATEVIEEEEKESEDPEITELTPEPEPTPSEPSGESKWASMKRKAKEETPTPPHWNPQINDWLMGKVVGTGQGRQKGNNRFAEVKVEEHSVRAKEKSGTDDQGKPKYDNVTVEPDDSVLLWERTSLKDLFDQIKAGKSLAVQFTGTKETSAGGNPAMLFDWYLES